MPKLGEELRCGTTQITDVYTKITDNTYVA